MANNVEIQWRKACEMRDKVQVFERRLTYNMRTLDEMLIDYVRCGFPEDIARKYYQNYYTPENQTIEEVSQDMRQRHVDFLDRVIAILDDARNQD